ncbi:GntR family transcriptional regulator [Sporosarcina sp. P26b]|uniref:FadR/GntR family transcriptional regulator n=1 Tax=Sporosarcina sp. P26b TaxID=2048253 RepID=UPI000C16F729|nr:FadR/GntR family transcriptional regulator [Sporosarcina sp. P26b]PIC94602.1 GntR family transcriptional regulator [Sporosarcina sp. P26b]
MSNQILEKLKEMIRDQEFPPNTKLPSENDLAKMFGVSRAPIREAISVLVASGLVESVQGGGNFVTDSTHLNNLDTVAYEMITDKEIYNLLELRTVLETEAAYFAAERHSEEDIKKISLALDEFAKTMSDNRVVGDEADYQFHLAVVEAAHNSFLTQSIENLSELYQKALKYSLSKNIGKRRKRESVYQEHLNIYNAIKCRDKERASFYMKKHLVNARIKLGDDRINRLGEFKEGD